MIIYSKNGLVDLKQLKIKRNTIVQENTTIDLENRKLYRTIKRAKNDLAFIENVARQELGMINKDEVIFKFSEKKQEKK